MIRPGLILVAALTAVVLTGGRAVHEGAGRAGSEAEVVVALASPPLAEAPGRQARIDAEQRAFRGELAARLPDARVHWRYRLVANGFSVVLPRRQIGALERLHGVRAVYESVPYASAADGTSPVQIGAPALWGPTLATAGQGIKIGIIDSGVDPSHPFFDPSSYTMPPGFPKGQVKYTTAKVIVARSFPPAGTKQPSARLAFAPDDDLHGTHVAGIAAGNPRTVTGTGQLASGVAPRAYIGNYKVFVQTDEGISPNANSPALVAAIEAAVADGMDVINFSGGEPQDDPSRDVVAHALDVAAEAGVVSVIAAGNDYRELGAGSITSPATATRTIAAAAVETSGSPPKSVLADFSSVGPAPVSYVLKPDVAAPGVDILSSVPGGGWISLDGTSMAAPQVAGAAALLEQRHPTWTAEEVKSALVQTGTNATDERGGALGPQFQGGGVIALTRADRPLLFAEPTAMSLGLLARGSRTNRTVELSDAGDGEGAWQVTQVRTPGGHGRARLNLPATVHVPGALAYQVVVPERAAQGDVAGYVVLRRGQNVRRIPFFGYVTAAAIESERAIPLTTRGVHAGTTRGNPRLVARYRYPADPSGIDVSTVLAGPEAVYRVRIRGRVANFGVVVTKRAHGVQVEPRVVSGQDENRLTGYAGLPFARSPYLDDAYFVPELAAGAITPSPGTYSVVFDSPTPAGAGRFRFRFWVNDVTPPTLRIRSRAVVAGQPLMIAATDAGSGVAPGFIVASVDGRRARETFEAGIVRVRTHGLAVGAHRLRLVVPDYQETKNTENVARILPNTRILTTTFTVRRP
jgi:subtilisin family serine protease